MIGTTTTVLKAPLSRKDWVLLTCVTRYHCQLHYLPKARFSNQHNKIQLTNIIIKLTNIIIQLTNIIIKYLPEHTRSQLKLIITSSSEVPEEIHNDVCRKRNDLRTSHEEADVIIPQQVLFAVEEGTKCVSDVFILFIHVFHLQQPLATILMETTKNGI